MEERGQRAKAGIFVEDAAILDEEATTAINEIPVREDVIKKYAEIHQISVEEAEAEVGAETVEEMLQKIKERTLEEIRAKQPPMNRAQRRALKKKVGAKKYAEIVGESNDVVGAVAETAKKLNYIDLIQKLRELNAKKENEDNGTTIDEDN